MTDKKTGNIKKIILIVIAVVIVFFLTSFIITKIVYDFTFKRYSFENNFNASEEKVIRLCEEMRFNSGENSLCGYHFDVDSENLVVFVFGYRAGLSDYIWQIKEFTDNGFDVFAFDSTGHINSEGRSSVGFSQIILDLDCALTFIEENPKFSYSDIFLFGHSRGGYAVCNILNKNHPISAAVSVSGINSAMEAVVEPAEKKVGAVAYGNWGFLWLYQTMLFGADTVNLEADEEISKSDVPVLIIHGDNDESVELDKFSIISHRQEITSERAEYLTCEETGQNGHINLLFDADGRANDELFDRINEFYLENKD